MSQCRSPQACSHKHECSATFSFFFFFCSPLPPHDFCSDQCRKNIRCPGWKSFILFNSDISHFLLFFLWACIGWPVFFSVFFPPHQTELFYYSMQIFVCLNRPVLVLKIRCLKQQRENWRLFILGWNVPCSCEVHLTFATKFYFIVFLLFFRLLAVEILPRIMEIKPTEVSSVFYT